MRTLSCQFILLAVLISICVINGAVNDKCHEKCDCEDLNVVCKLGKVPSESFGDFFDPSVTKMHIDNSDAETSLNDKTKLEPLTSQILTYEDLTNLTLKDCYIETIDDDAFKDIVALKYLNLDENKITTLTSRSFFGLRHLQSLSMKSNKLSTIPGGAFEPLISVVTLILSNNLIDTIQSGAFPKQALIEYLDIGGNPNIRTIPPAVDALITLDKLIARDCKINELRDNWLQKFPGLIEVDLTNNLIVELKQSHFGGLTELRKVSYFKSGAYVFWMRPP